MAIDALVKPLLRLPLFQGLKPLQLTEIVRRAGRIVYRPGDVLIEEDAIGDGAIVIVSGETYRMVREDSSQPAEAIAEGSMLAELSMLVETVHTATVIARSQVRALKISRADLHEQMLEDPELAEHLTARIAQRLHTLAAELRAVDSALATLAQIDGSFDAPSDESFTLPSPGTFALDFPTSAAALH